MSVLRILLAPFAWLYGAVLLVRHACYDHGLLESTRIRVPSIGVGNLALGGTGKTPHVELILRILEGLAPIAMLSRGYGRKGTGVREVLAMDSADQVGDEPLQIKRKFPGVHVHVGADRRSALEQMTTSLTVHQAIILDDAFQHRRIDVGLDILLTTWQNPYSEDTLLPAGRLRDLPSRARVADVVVVSKCPELPTETERQAWRKRLGLRHGQELFFSGIVYDRPRLFDPQGLSGTDEVPLATHLLLLTGIADPAPLVRHLRTQVTDLEHIAFPDHHRFTSADLARLAERFNTFAAGPKMLITTEKDAARLSSVIAGSPLEGSPLCTIGMKAVILNEPERFADLIRDHVASHPTHR